MIGDLAREQQRVDHVFDLTGKLPADEEVLAHWARYLCIVTFGLLENSVRLMLSDYASRHANDEVTRHSQRHIQRLSNLNAEGLCGALGSFSPAWRSAFEADLSDEQRDAIDSLVANRHLIAHGRNVGITVGRVRGYCKSVIRVLKWIHENCARH